MGYTITEKILLDHTQVKNIKPGDIIQVDVDFIMTNDISGPVSVKQFEKMGAKKVFDIERMAIILDHFTPNKDLSAAEACKTMRNFAEKYGIKNFYDAGSGIEHVIMHEKGYVKPGDLIIGGDSHTVTYGGLGAFSTGVGSTDLAGVMALGKIWLKVPSQLRFVYKGKIPEWVGGKDLIIYTIGQIGTDGARYKTMEFSGEVIKGLEIEDRLTMCNMAIEAGAKNGIIEPDDKTECYMREEIGITEYRVYKSDDDARYEATFEFDVSNLEPQVAVPFSPGNAKGVSEVTGIPIDQVVIGSCTNGRLKDLREAAKILKNNKVHPKVRAIIFPGSKKIYKQALKEGLIDIFINSGAMIAIPGCGVCFGGHMGVLAEGERAVSTTNRNFVGRMGHKSSEVFLSNPAVAAASAIKGVIAHPEEVV